MRAHPALPFSTESTVAHGLAIDRRDSFKPPEQPPKPAARRALQPPQAFPSTIASAHILR